MAAPERLNVLLSRARNALIMFGNANTFLASRKGKNTWHPFMEMLKTKGHIYDGVPVQCHRHVDRKQTIKSPEEFDKECPDGGCTEPWYELLGVLEKPC